jgi:hypothetical protein
MRRDPVSWRDVSFSLKTSLLKWHGRFATEDEGRLEKTPFSTAYLYVILW